MTIALFLGSWRPLDSGDNAYSWLETAKTPSEETSQILEILDSEKGA